MKPPPGIVTTLILSVALCAGQTESKPAIPKPAHADTPTAPEGAKSTVAPYVIGPLDVLEIRVWNDPKLSGFVNVGPDGMISMPLIGEFKAEGLTRAELTTLIKDKLSSVMNEPEVNIQASRMNSKRIFVHGGVNRQGEMPLTGEMTILDALSNCGGFKEFSDPKKIYVLRGGKQLKFNYNDVKKGKHMDQNIVLQNGDHIFVPE